MRIIYIGTFRLPCYDAAAPRVLNNAKIFRAIGHEVSFISWGGKYREQDRCEDGKYRVDGFEYVITGELDAVGFINRVKSRLFRGKKTMNLLLRMRVNPDLIIMYNAGYSQTKRMMRFCESRGVKLANDITEWYSNNELRVTGIIPNALNMKGLQHKVLNKIVISSMLDNYYPESNNLLLPPLCDLSELKWNQTVEDERITSFEGITMIYAGNPAKKDCLHTVINAVNGLAAEGAPIRFLILGTTREAYWRNYHNLIGGSQLHSNIIFLGRVSQELIPAYYKKADFMVLLREPTRKSNAGFPTKVAESMTAGVPVICNETSDLASYVHDGENGFIVDGYSLHDIMKVLRDKILPLKREDINRMKDATAQSNSAFVYSSYKNEAREFLNNLK